MTKPQNSTAIVVPIFVPGHAVAGALGQMQRAVSQGADWIELRCDEANRQTMGEALRAGRRLRLPMIVTLRSVAEGGRFAGSDDELAQAVELAAQLGAEWVDVEFARWQRSLSLRQRVLAVCQQVERGTGPGLILSAHDFGGRPADLRERIVAMAHQQRTATIIKLAWKAASVVDAVEALELIEDTRRRFAMPLVPLAMGEFGQISRLLAAKFRAPFTFATLAGDAGSAPGQPSVQDLRTTFRWQAQRPGTAVCGVVGWPVGHSLSPAIHNAGFGATGFGGVYVPLPVAPAYEDFAGAVDALRACAGLHLRGLSVTIPHKENALRFVRERGGAIDPLSAHIGAINTIVFDADGLLRGFNSDYSGALDALLAAMTDRPGPIWAGKPDQSGTLALAGVRVGVLGAGGAARAIVAALANAGATTVIYNRTLPKAQALAAEFDGHTGKVVAAAFDRLCLSCCQVYINCTPVGMHPHEADCPVSETNPPAFGPDVVVFDTIYNPLETRLLKLARAQGARVIPGLEMFVRQAGLQFREFTGQAAPLDLFRAVALAALKAR